LTPPRHRPKGNDCATAWRSCRWRSPTGWRLTPPDLPDHAPAMPACLRNIRPR
jgi:hypothetical protein